MLLTTDQELWTHKLMCRIICCDHSLDLKEFLDQLNLIYIWICLYFVIDQELWASKLIDRIIGCDHSLGQKKVLKFICYFMIIFITIYILLVPFSHQGSAIMFSF
jgi:hypothetical protein